MADVVTSLYNTNILARTLKYASTFTTNEGIYSHFFFTNTGVITTDGTFLFKADLKGTGLPNASLPVKSMMRFLSVCPSEQVSWKYGLNNNSVIFCSGTYESQIPNTYIEAIPSPKELFGEPLTNIKQKPKQQVNITVELIQAINKISFCKVPIQDAEKQEIQGVRVEKDGVFSTDSYAISHVSIDTGVSAPFTIPAKLVDFILQYGLAPKACFITKDYMVLRYDNILIIGRLKNSPYPATILKQIRDFKPSEHVKFDEKTDARNNTIKRLAISEGTTLMITPLSETTLSFSLQDRLGNKTAEQISATNTLTTSIMTGFKFFKSGYKYTNDIDIAFIDDDRIQLMFTDESFQYTLLGRVA